MTLRPLLWLLVGLGVLQLARVAWLYWRWYRRLRPYPFALRRRPPS